MKFRTLIRLSTCLASARIILLGALQGAALCCFLLTSSCRGKDMSFNATEDSFRDFTKCAVSNDLASNKIEFRDAWLQNVVTAQEYFGEEGQAEPVESDEPKDEAYVITGVVRTTSGGDSSKDSTTIVLVNKVLDKYKVVNWATNLDEEQEMSLPELSMKLMFTPYEGRCSW